MPRWDHIDDDEFAPHVEAICVEYGITIKGLQDGRRTPFAVEARRALALRLKDAGMLLPRIAKVLRKDLSTIHYYVHPVRERNDRARYEARKSASMGEAL